MFLHRGLFLCTRFFVYTMFCCVKINYVYLLKLKIMNKEILLDYKEMLLNFVLQVDELIEKGENEELDFSSLVDDLNDSNKEFM